MSENAGDFSKAFDRINRTKMMANLIGVLEPYRWRALHNYYSISIVIIVDSKDKNVKFKIHVTIGVKQGGPLSPKLFIKHVNPMLKALKDAGCILAVESIIIGLLAYADDTLTVCETIEDVIKSVAIIESFCDKEDIILNGKKTVWMKLGEKPLIHPITKKRVPKPAENNERFVAGKALLNKVYDFKYLGYIVTSDNRNMAHVEKRKQVALMAKTELNKIDLKNALLDPEIKGMMIQTLVRSRLLYGLENCCISEDTIDKLQTFENNILKEYLGVPRQSYSTPLLDIVKVKPLKDALAIRRYSLLLQLITNELTTKVILSNIEHEHYTLVTECGYQNEDSMDPIAKRNKIASACLSSIKQIREANKNETLDAYTKAIDYLMRHNTADNRKLIKFMLHSKNKLRDMT